MLIPLLLKPVEAPEFNTEPCLYLNLGAYPQRCFSASPKISFPPAPASLKLHHGPLKPASHPGGGS